MKKTVSLLMPAMLLGRALAAADLADIPDMGESSHPTLYIGLILLGAAGILLSMRRAK